LGVGSFFLGVLRKERKGNGISPNNEERRKHLRGKAEVLKRGWLADHLKKPFKPRKKRKSLSSHYWGSDILKGYRGGSGEKGRNSRGLQKGELWEGDAVQRRG